MRDDLRRSCTEIWVIDCSPEGHQPDVPTRIFQGVQQPICIVLAARTLEKHKEIPAHVHFRTLPKGPREQKFAALAAIGLKDGEWTDCANGWRDPFLPKPEGAWAEFPDLDQLFSKSFLGVMPGRTWVIAPDVDSLLRRWSALTRERNADRKELLFHPHIRRGKPGDKHLKKTISKGLTGHVARLPAVIHDHGQCISPTRYGFRSFDRQWIIPDARLINQPSPTLWDIYSARQIHLTALKKAAPSSGPAISFTSLIPDHDHYKRVICWSRFSPLVQPSRN